MMAVQDGSALAGVGKRLISCPVVVHRWFSSGEGWSWRQEGTPRDFVECLKNVLGSRPAAAEVGQFEAGTAWWLYHHAPDPQLLDPKVRNRHPSILRAVALPGQPKSQYRQQLVRRLLEVPLPEHAGENPKLFVEVPLAWLEIAQDQRRTPAGVPSVRGSPPRRKIWLWRGFIIVILSVILFVVLIAVLWNVMTMGGVSPTDVREKLLQPLGVPLGPSATKEEVIESFRRLYCQKGMIEHFFPGSTIDVIKQASQGARHGSSSHPDCVFARNHMRNIQEFHRVINRLPENPFDAGMSSHGKFSWWKWPISPDKLSVVVNGVAKKIPDRSKTAASDTSVKILEESVVDPLRHAGFCGGTKQGAYEKWFVREFRWQPGEGFPWEKSVDDTERKVALLFSRQAQVSSEQRAAAEKMQKWLSQRGVAGLSEEDTEKRPWSVGRCFVEFLSLKHLQRNEEEGNKLDREGSLLWEQLKNLPPDGWPVGENGWHPDPERPWEAVRLRLRELAKRLGEEASGLDSALVLRIIYSIEKWRETRGLQLRKEAKEKQQLEDAKRRVEEDVVKLEDKIAQREREREELDKKVKELSSNTTEWDETTDQIKKIKKELEDLKNKKKAREKELQELRETRNKDARAKRLESSNDRVNKLWHRLTGSNVKGEPTVAGER